MFHSQLTNATILLTLASGKLTIALLRAVAQKSSNEDQTAAIRNEPKSKEKDRENIVKKYFLILFIPILLCKRSS